MPLMMTGRIFQYQSNADSADITMTSGNTWNAKVVRTPGFVTSNGGGPPPRKP
jgi:hypothetical protein